MSARAAAIIASLATLALLAAIFLGGPSRGYASVAQGTPACPGLTISTATRIEISHAGKTLTLARDDSAWTVPAEDGRAIRPGRAEALLAAMQATIFEEPRTENPARYARLGVEDADAPAATSTLVRVLGDDGAAIAALVLGHTESSDHMFVRRPGEQQAWLARSAVAASADLSDWLGMRLLDISSDDVAKIAIDRADGGHLLLTREADALTLAEPAGHPPVDTNKVGDVGRAVRAIDWTQARKSDLPGTPLGHAVVTTQSGQVVTITVNLDGADGWVAMDAASDSGWIFRVSAVRAKNIVPALADLLAYALPPAKARK